MTPLLALIDEITFELLTATVDLAAVFQDVPDNYTNDVVIIGDLSAEPFTDDPADPDRRISLTINSVTIGDERAPCSAIQAQVEAALGSARVTRDGWELIYRSLGSDGTLASDGSGYVGITTFEIIAFGQN
jgi:hypothetical protein